MDVSSAEAFLAKFALLDKDGYFSEPEEEDPVGDPVESPKRKRKRRRAGQISGRQLALNRIEKEKKKHEGELKDAPHQKTTTRQRPPLPPFVEAVEDMRRTLLEFSAEEEGAHLTFTEDQASAMRVYTSQKYGLTSKVSLKVSSQYAFSIVS